jgi:hypothetical protein
MTKMKKLLISMILFILVAGFGLAYNTQVMGTIYDASSNTVSGADVSVTCNSIIKTTTSGATGEYLVTYPQADCGFNTTVYVTATKDDQTGNGQGLTCVDAKICYGIPVALVDVTIPEFTVIAGLVAVIGTVGVIIYRKKD